MRSMQVLSKCLCCGRLNPSQVAVLNHNRHGVQGVTIAPASSTSTCTAPPGSPPVTHHSDWPSSTSTCTAPPGSPPVTHHSDWPHHSGQSPTKAMGSAKRSSMLMHRPNGQHHTARRPSRQPPAPGGPPFANSNFPPAPPAGHHPQ